MTLCLDEIANPVFDTQPFERVKRGKNVLLEGKTYTEGLNEVEVSYNTKTGGITIRSQEDNKFYSSRIFTTTEYASLLRIVDKEIAEGRK